MNERDDLYDLAIRYRPDSSPFDEKYLLQNEKDRLFGMSCNGYFLDKNRKWEFNNLNLLLFAEEFANQQVVLFGPGSNEPFFNDIPVSTELFELTFAQKSVTDVIRKYRRLDENQAARISYLFGGIIRHLSTKSVPAQTISEAVEYIARMTMLGEEKSGEAIASAMAMYVISRGSLNKDNHFTGNVFRMAEAIREDPIVPYETKDLGLSQLRRLRSFIDKDNKQFPDMIETEIVFEGFPTVGAEFHFNSNAPSKHPNFWQRLAILNMSQYQKGSFVQFSRDDRGVIEVRMNPSIYLGQTVKVEEGKYQFTGCWGGEEGTNGQLSIYSGFGENLPYLAYNLSMALHKPSILGPDERYFLQTVKTLHDALSVSTKVRSEFFKAIQRNINRNEVLNQTTKAGGKIMGLLNP